MTKCTNKTTKENFNDNDINKVLKIMDDLGVVRVDGISCKINDLQVDYKDLEERYILVNNHLKRINSERYKYEPYDRNSGAFKDGKKIISPQDILDFMNTYKPKMEQLEEENRKLKEKNSKLKSENMTLSSRILKKNTYNISESTIDGLIDVIWELYQLRVKLRKEKVKGK